MCYDNLRRRRQQAVLTKFMKRKCVIALQGVHGSEAMLLSFIDTQPYPYKVFFSEFPRSDDVDQNATGGVASLVPWLSPMELEQLQPHQRPSFAHQELAPQS